MQFIETETNSEARKSQMWSTSVGRHINLRWTVQRILDLSGKASL